MSLAFNASPFNSDNDYVDIKNGDTPITRKKQTNNRTQKRPINNGNGNGNTEKVNALLSSIHNSSPVDNEMGDFNPPAPPQSAGVQNTISKEQQQQQQEQQQKEPTRASDDEVDMMAASDKSSSSSSSYAEDYYRKMIPNYGKPPGVFQAQDYYRQQSYAPSYEGAPYIRPPMMSNGRGGDIMEKLNYMINLLEESQDERTGSVTEEVILYSFLGIFIIFIADSFARVGKYTR